MLFHPFTIIRNFSTKKTNFYITTPIYYVNASPHIGHLYTSLIADGFQRWQKLQEPHIPIVFVTGTDEHGTKIQQAALKNNSDVEEYCKTISEKYKLMSKKFDICHTDFIRTTDLKHQKSVQEFWKVLKSNGHIYSSKYSGWYCVSDETFLTDSQIKYFVKADGTKIKVSEESGHPVEWTEEQNYMFRLSAFQNDLIYWLTRNENIVKPKKFQKILLDMLSNEELPDVSISRPISRVHWGIKVPEDNSQTIYVWLDALINYLTAAGYPEVHSQQFIDSWPPDVHVIGKDILKFHGIYWPAFLLAAKLDLPRSVLCHSHWTVDGEKMSKSKHNIVCPMQRSEEYTTDGLRYFLLREGVAHSDGNYSDIKVTRILNSELADTIGNLLNRCCSNALNPNQLFPEIDLDTFKSISSLDITKTLIHSVTELQDICTHHYRDFNFYKVVDSVISTLHTTNQFIDTLKPWKLKKDNMHKQLDIVLHTSLETLRVCSIALQPIIPNIAEQILNKLSTPAEDRLWSSMNKLSWNGSDFRVRHLSSNAGVVFKRIRTEEQQKQKRTN